jgi:hypothetical protein
VGIPKFPAFPGGIGVLGRLELWLPPTSIKGAQGCPADADFAG